MRLKSGLMRKSYRLACSLLLLSQLAFAQDLGKLQVRVVRGDNGQALSGVTVRISDREGKTKGREVITDATGQVLFPGLEPGEYIVELSHPELGGESSVVRVQAGEQATMFSAALDSGDEATFTVRDKKLLVDTGNPTQGSVTKRDREFMDRQLTEKSLQGLLTTVPGMQRNSMGQTHVRGEHKSIAFSLDGVAVPIPMASTTSQPIDTEFLQSVEVRTGALDGSQSGQTGMVLDSQTPDDVDPFFEYKNRVGNLGQIENVMKAGGRNDQGNFSFFLGGRTSATNLQFEAPSPNAQTLNNRGLTQSYMMRMTGRTAEDQVGMTLSHQQNDYQLPQTQENFDAGVRQDQIDTNTMALLSWKRKVDEDSDLLMSMAYLQSGQDVNHNGVFTPWNLFDANISQDLADAGLPADPERPGSPYLPTTRLRVRQFQPSATYTHRMGERHFLTAGANANFMSSSQNVNLLDPGGGGGLPDGVAQFDSRIDRNGLAAGIFFSHTLPLSEQLTLNYGARAEIFENGLDVKTSQISPLFNLAYAFNERNVVRFSFNRSFQAPPLEIDVTGQTIVLPQRLSIYELSYESQLSDTVTAKAALVRKDYRDQVDIGLLIPNSNIPLFAPVNYGAARYDGLELSVNTHNPLGLNGFFTTTISEARPTVAGAFADLTEFNDHDQRIQLTAGASYLWENGLSVAVDGFYGSGFPQPGLPLYQAVGINPYGISSERQPRFLANFSVQYQPKPSQDGPDFSGGLQVLNLFDNRPLLNFYSAFSGTRFVQQRRFLLNAAVRF
jgi:hypothetical protein